MDDLRQLQRIIDRQDRAYHGKYRGFVEDTADPESRGRVKVTVPSVLGTKVSSWALPAFPYGGGAGFGFIAVPPAGSQVFVEFIEGDISVPVWTGTFWRTAEEKPEEVADPATSKVLKTEAGHVLVFEDDDSQPHVTLRSSADAAVTMDHNGSMELTGSDGAVVKLDAEAGTLTIEDANGNTIEMSSSGVTVSDANGNSMAMEGGGVTIESAMVTIKGETVGIGSDSGQPLIKGPALLTAFNTHTHNATAIGAPTSPPMKPLATDIFCEKAKGA